MSVLHLVRHGQASFGQGHYDRLSDMGHTQARLTGAYLGGQGLVLDAAYCGGLARQRDTARAVLEGLASPPPLAVLPEFDEYDSGSIIEALLPAMRQEDPTLEQTLPAMFNDRRTFQAIYEGAMLRWISGRYDLDGAETWAAFLKRVSQGLERVQADNGRGRTVAVFTSGGPISAAMRLALGLADDTALRLTWVIKNASLTSFLYHERRLTLSLFNSTAHLEQGGQPGLITYR